MLPEELREICRAGGQAAHEQGKAHEWDTEHAKAAGKKGGRKIATEKGRAHMARIGRLGGQAAARKRAEKKTSEQ
jgi:general stress protein YciG